MNLQKSFLSQHFMKIAKKQKIWNKISCTIKNFERKLLENRKKNELLKKFSVGTKPAKINKS